MSVSQNREGYECSFSKFEMKLLYNALKLNAGDFKEAFKGGGMWEPEIRDLMKKFPDDIKF